MLAAVFFALGNLTQIAVGQPAVRPLAFFVGEVYGHLMGTVTAPGALGMDALTLVSVAEGAAALARVPIVMGLADVIGRWHAQGRFEPEGTDLVLMLLVLSLAATLVMVAIFAVKAAGTPWRPWGSGPLLRVHRADDLDSRRAVADPSDRRADAAGDPG